MKTLTINIPETLTVNGMKDAPERLRVVKTENWDETFILTAIRHGVSQKLGDTWSVGKKDIAKLEAVFAAIECGDWQVREKGVSSTKFTEKLTAMSAEDIWKTLTPQQQAALAAMGKTQKDLVK